MEKISPQAKILFSQQLAEGIKELKLTISADKQDVLLAYLELLAKWNQSYNLSGIKDPALMLNLHLLDSLSILPFTHGQSVLDVGTGAGLPGLPVAICEPGKKVSLLDSNGKKTRFLFQTCVQLGIKNVEVINDRAESYQSIEVFDIVLSRAYSTLAKVIEQTRHLLGEKSKLLAMKGQYPQAEINDLPDDFRLLAVHELKIPGEQGARHLLELSRV